MKNSIIKNSNQLNVKSIKTETMTNLDNSVDFQGKRNTNEMNEMMNLYTSSFTENFTKGFMKMYEHFNTSLQDIVIEQNDVKKPTVQKSKTKRKNKGFEKLKNQLLREKLQNCKKIKFDSKSHIRGNDLGHKSIHVLSSMSMKTWKKYFSKGNVYIDKDMTTSMLLPKIIFDKSIKRLFVKKNEINSKKTTESTSTTESQDTSK